MPEKVLPEPRPSKRNARSLGKVLREADPDLANCIAGVILSVVLLGISAAAFFAVAMVIGEMLGLRPPKEHKIYPGIAVVFGTAAGLGFAYFAYSSLLLALMVRSIHVRLCHEGFYVMRWWRPVVFAWDEIVDVREHTVVRRCIGTFKKRDVPAMTVVRCDGQKFFFTSDDWKVWPILPGPLEIAMRARGHAPHRLESQGKLEQLLRASSDSLVVATPTNATSSVLLIRGITAPMGLLKKLLPNPDVVELQMLLLAWRSVDGEVCREKLLLRQTISKATVQYLERKLASFAIVELRIVLDPRASGPQQTGVLVEFKDIVEGDMALNLIAMSLRDQPAIDDPQVGRWEYSPNLACYQRLYKHREQSIYLFVETTQREEAIRILGQHRGTLAKLTDIETRCKEFLETPATMSVFNSPLPSLVAPRTGEFVVKVRENTLVSIFFIPAGELGLMFAQYDVADLRVTELRKVAYSPERGPYQVSDIR